LLSKVTVATMISLAAALQPPSRPHAHPRDRTLAIATVALLLSGVFDVGRALYCRYRLSYAVTQSASLLAGRPLVAAGSDANALSAAAADLVRRISGLRDLPRSSVRVSSASIPPTTGYATEPTRMTLTVRYTVPLLSPHVRALFRNGVVALEAVAVRTTPTPVPSPVAMCSAV
jgi:hypothetical protein